MNNSLIIALGIAATLSFDCTISYCQDTAHDNEVFRHSQEYTSPLADVYAKLKPVFQKYYPAATMTNAAANGLHFEYEVTNFNFSTPAQPGAGALRENPIQRGPKHGGILCNVYLEKGKYGGQLAMAFKPVNGGEFAEAVIDKKEYKELLLAPYSTKRDANLWVVLLYPPDASGKFVEEFRVIIKSFISDAN
jgi:hypothetical protein